MAPDGGVIDLLGMAHVNHVAGVHFPPGPLPQWGQRAMRAFDETSASSGWGQLSRSSLRISLIAHRCYTYHRSDLKAAVLSGTLDLIVLHSPAYWPLLGMCGASQNQRCSGRTIWLHGFGQGLLVMCIARGPRCWW